jgi:hypothetical protein
MVSVGCWVAGGLAGAGLGEEGAGLATGGVEAGGTTGGGAAGSLGNGAGDCGARGRLGRGDAGGSDAGGGIGWLGPGSAGPLLEMGGRLGAEGLACATDGVTLGLATDWLPLEDGLVAALEPGALAPPPGLQAASSPPSRRTETACAKPAISSPQRRWP